MHSDLNTLILSNRTGVVEKPRVGGLSFLVNGSVCCGVTGRALMVRVGAEARERTLAEAHVRPMEFAGRPLAGFVSVDPAGFRTDAALGRWVKKGVDFVATQVEGRATQSTWFPRRARRG